MKSVGLTYSLISFTSTYLILYLVMNLPEKPLLPCHLIAQELTAKRLRCPIPNSSACFQELLSPGPNYISNPSSHLSSQAHDWLMQFIPPGVFCFLLTPFPTQSSFLFPYIYPPKSHFLHEFSSYL